jgi:hypothetical protein
VSGSAVSCLARSPALANALTPRNPPPYIARPAPTIQFSGLDLASTAPGASIATWPNAGSTGSAQDAAVLAADGAATVELSGGRPYVKLAAGGHATVPGSITWSTSAGGGWTILAYVRAPASSARIDERFFEFANVAGDGIIMYRCGQVQ